MKKFTLSILAVVMAAFVLTSCIDNAVSPEVKNIRAEQVNLLKAQTAVQTAEAALKNAMAAYQNSVAAENLAEADHRDAETAKLIIELEEEQADADVHVAQQEILLQQAIDNLAAYLVGKDLNLATVDATPGDGVGDGGYIALYSAAYAAAKTQAVAIANQNYKIALLELALSDLDATGGVNADGETIATLRAFETSNVAEAQLELANATAALAILVGVADDPATAQTAWATNEGVIQGLKNDSLQAKIDLVPYKITFDAADLTLNGAGAVDGSADVLDDAQIIADAVTLVEAAYDGQDAKATAAVAKEATKLAAAIAASASIQAELDPFLTALLEAYTAGSAFVGEIASNEHDLRVAINMWKVALSQGYKLVDFDPTADISDAPSYGDALSAMEDAIDAIQTLADIDLNIDVEDETTYPGFDAEDLAEFVLNVDATTLATAVGTVYSDGTTNYRVSVAAAAAATSLQVTAPSGSSVVPVVSLLAKVGAGAGDAAVNYTSLASTINGAYAANDEDGLILYEDGYNALGGSDDELVSLYDAVVDLMVNPDPGTELAQAGLYLGVIKPFFQTGAASDLVDDMGRYDGANFLSNLTDESDLDFTDGVVADLPEDGDGSNGWTAYWAAQTASATASDILDAVTEGDAANDSPTQDYGDDYTDLLADYADAWGTALDNIDDAYDIIEDLDTTDEDLDAQGGYDAAEDVTAAVTADLTAATATYTTDLAAYTAAAAAKKPFDTAVTTINKKLADARLLKGALGAYIDSLTGVNALVNAANVRVELAKEALDDAKRALAEVDMLEAKGEEYYDAAVAELADMVEEYNARLDEAAAWLALLNAAIGS